MNYFSMILKGILDPYHLDFAYCLFGAFKILVVSAIQPTTKSEKLKMQSRHGLG